MITARLGQVVAHQNQLRARKHIPLLCTNLHIPDPDFEAGSFDLTEVGGFGSDESTLGHFLVRGSSYFRAQYGDMFALNYVYNFQESNLVSVKPFAQWYLENRTEGFISLYREMGQDEFRLWQQGHFDQLGSESWQPGQKVTHFSTDFQLTTAAAGSNSKKIILEVRREDLLSLARTEGIRSGILDEQAMVVEIVLTNPQLRRLIGGSQTRLILPSN